MGPCQDPDSIENSEGGREKGEGKRGFKTGEGKGKKDETLRIESSEWRDKSPMKQGRHATERIRENRVRQKEIKKIDQ